VGRWKDKFPAQQLAKFEALIGGYMQELGYMLSNPSTSGSLWTKTMRATYEAFYGLKQWAKINTPLSRMTVNYSDILIDK
jgi:hypothetical protein